MRGGNVYVGPYVKVRVPVVKTQDNTPWCPKCDQRRGDTNFCPDCGSELVLKENWVSAPSPHWSIPKTCVLRCTATDGRLTDDHVHYIFTIGNGRTDFNERQRDEDNLHRFWHGGFYSQGVDDLQSVVVPEQVAWMRARCQEEIESISRVFGAGNVGFGWGVVTNRR